MKTVFVVFGTRPEAIKMCPLVKELRKRNNIKTVVCVSGQHREMLDAVTEAFGVNPDYDLSVMRAGQTLFDITTSILLGIKKLLEDIRPDIVLVHGDTTTAYASALAAFYLKIPVGHVEAGLRTYDIYSPYPEEFNRQAISLIAKYNFAPTELARNNLIDEGRSRESIYVTGNTVIDALRITLRADYTHSELEWAKDGKLVLMTAHRRENIGEPMRGIFRVVRRVVEENGELRVIYPVHMNPEVRRIAEEELSGCDRIHLTEPLGVIDFHNFIARSYVILTDSGGVQEEASALGIPVLVMRDTTERGEGITEGNLKLIGCSEESVYAEFTSVIHNEEVYLEMSHATNIYGDGRASQRIADIVEK